MSMSDILYSLLGFMRLVLPLDSFMQFLNTVFGYTGSIGSTSFIVLYLGSFVVVCLLFFFVIRLIYVFIKNILWG